MPRTTRAQEPHKHQWLEHELEELAELMPLAHPEPSPEPETPALAEEAQEEQSQPQPSAQPDQTEAEKEPPEQKQPFAPRQLSTLLHEAKGLLVSLEEKNYEQARKHALGLLLPLVLLLIWLLLRAMRLILFEFPWFLACNLIKHLRNSRKRKITGKGKAKHHRAQHRRHRMHTHPFLLMHLLRHFGHMGGHHHR